MSTVKIILYGWLAFIIVGVLTGGSATIGGIAMIITWYVLFKNRKSSQTETENDDSPSKDEELPSYIKFATVIEAKEKNGEKSSFSDALKMNYYLITEKVRCENCLRSVTVPIYTGHSNLILWKEYYPKCDNNENGWHSFDAVDGSERYLELMECSEDEKGIVYFKNHWWKIKSGQFVYIRHLREDKSINQKYYDDY